MEHQSATRVPNKPLRKFAGYTLYDIYLRKFKAMQDSPLFCGAGIALWREDEELVSQTKWHEIPIIWRDELSANGRTNKEVFSFLKDVDAEAILRVNACLPFQKVSTLLSMAEYFHSHDVKSLEPVIRRTGWFWDSSGIKVGGHAEDTKGALGLRESTQGAHIFNRELMLKRGQCFGFTGDSDPHLFEIDDQYEAVDIDTEADFAIAEALFAKIGKERWDEISKP